MFQLKTKCFCYDVNVRVSFKPRESTDQNPKVSFCDDWWEYLGPVDAKNTHAWKES